MRNPYSFDDVSDLPADLQQRFTVAGRRNRDEMVLQIIYDAPPPKGQNPAGLAKRHVEAVYIRTQGEKPLKNFCGNALRRLLSQGYLFKVGNYYDMTELGIRRIEAWQQKEVDTPPGEE